VYHLLRSDQCSVKMIPSLRFLCLEKAIACAFDDEDYLDSDLPCLLIRDINLMKVFNGTYTYGDAYEMVQLKIFYDGKVWNFKSRTWYHSSDGEGTDGNWVCHCKYCWDTTGSNRFHFTVRECEFIQTESSFLDFLGILRLEQEDMNLYGWKFEVDHQRNNDKYPYLVETYDEVKSLGAIAFHGVGQGEPVCGRFQVEVANTPEKEGLFGLMSAREGTYLHCIVRLLVQSTILSYTIKMSLDMNGVISVCGGILRVVRFIGVLVLSLGFKRKWK